jgi:hypothetical protein
MSLGHPKIKTRIKKDNFKSLTSYYMSHSTVFCLYTPSVDLEYIEIV